MTTPSAPEATVASPFQVGLRCPVCQGAVAIGDALLNCRACASAHHAGCWTQVGHCSSYHCDTRTQAAVGRAPEIVVTVDETARVTVAPPRAPVSSAEVAARLKQQGPRRWSPGAVVGAGASFVLLGVATLVFLTTEALTGPGALMALGGMLASFVLGLACALSAASVFRDRERKGLFLALAGMLLCVASAALCVGTVVKTSARGAQHAGAPFTLADPEPPAPESFERAPAPIANAMRANVFVAGRTAGVVERAWCGAGVILGTQRGTTYLLTNRHVIDPPGALSSGEHDITLKFANGEVAQAQVEWTAPEGVDLGVLSCRIMRPPRVTTCLRRVAPQVSERVFAIGNPHELSWTYTEGAVSRVHEKHAPSGIALEVIQTQTPIQPGNSGGGLYDAQGRLVGINTWVVDSTNGPGFAIATRTILQQMPPRFAEVAVSDVEDTSEEERPR